MTAPAKEKARRGAGRNRQGVAIVRKLSHVALHAASAAVGALAGVGLIAVVEIALRVAGVVS
jgi:hypothetical protein